ncbi:MAG: DUF2461 domain-containing protein [Caulobacteraceae bacterium]
MTAKAATRTAETGAFTGFGPKALSFFDALAANQDRDWFAAHKQTYEAQVRRPMEALVESLAVAFAAHDIPLTGSAKASIFRIHRDVRFTRDKSPYKTHAGAVLSRDGTKEGRGILYVQVGGAEKAFLAMGFYHPEPRDLAAIREAIAAAPQRWLAVEGELGEAGLALSRGDALARMPRGFEALAGSPVEGALKLRSVVTSRTLAPERIFGAGLIDDVLAFAKAGLPLLSFGRGAIERARGRGG